MSAPVVILGLGFTTRRLARRLCRRGIRVYAIVRDPDRFSEPAALGVQMGEMSARHLPKAAVLVHSIPPLDDPGKTAVRNLISKIQPRRIVYISSTGVYGAHSDVSENTAAAPNDEKGRARLDEEKWIASCSAWSSLILRSAAIYGPGRGVHVRVREGKSPRGVGRIVSRIHVDDLVAILEAGIESDVTGAWPAADDQPAESGEVAAWCARRMGIDPLLRMEPSQLEGRRVNGKRIRELLGVYLKYASYETGLGASLLEEEENRRGNGGA